MSVRTTILDAVSKLLRPSVPSKPAPEPAQAKLPPDVPAMVEAPKRVTWMYQLQNVRPSTMSACGSTYKVIDQYGAAGWVPWKRGELSIVRGPSKSKLLAYLSIGEAETYRPYWGLTKSKPWLDKENPDWPGNYKVQFWHPAWQKIIFAQIDDIIASGFDGAYLDIVDAYEYYKRPYDMIRFVVNIAKYARAKKPGFLIFPQNADGLLDDPLYLATIDGLGREDWLYGEVEDGEKNAMVSVTASRVRMAKLIAAGKPVLSVEYLAPNLKDEIDIARKTHNANGFSLLIVPRRELDVPICPV
jgi:cysteinyl-tRNA synthetase, unknown class